MWGNLAASVSVPLRPQESPPNSSDLDRVGRGCMARLARGEQAALGELYQLHGARVRAFIQSIVHHNAEADDLTHEVFLSVWRNARQYDPERGRVFGWILLQARSRAIDRLRSVPRSKTVALEESGLDTRAAPGPAHPELLLDLRRMPEILRSLSEAEREVLLLGTLQGSTCSEIAEELQIPIGTVKSRTKSALTKIRQWLALPEPTQASRSSSAPESSPKP